jgi:hypothetical protein
MVRSMSGGDVTGSGKPPSARPGARPFVGRARQKAELDAALDAVLGGEGRLVFLTGEPGIGKTSLLDQVDARARARGVRVAWGRCWESGAAPAYFPFQGALAALWRALDEDERRALATPETAHAGQLLPGLAALVPAPAAEGDPARARFVLFEAVASLLRLASRRAPVLLALDDLHDADRSSLALLSYLSRDLRSMATLIVGTYRDVEARLSPEVGAELARVGREGVTLALPRLDRDESTELARALAAGEVDGRGAEALYRATQGNPLFIGEMLRAGDLGGQGAALPQSVREVVRQRLGLLSDGARVALEAAAALGDEFTAAAVADALGLPVAGVEAAVAAATAAGMVVSVGRRLRFAHALFREALYRELPAPRRRELHAAILASLERLHEGDPRAPVAELSYHALEAGPAMLPRAVTYVARAADAALDVAAYEDALALLERVCAQVLEQSSDVRLRGESLLALALARIRAGEARAGKEACLQVAALARAARDGELFARAALGFGAEILVGVVDPLLVGLLEESLALLPPGDSPLRVGVLARLAGALQPSENPEHPIALAREAISGARRLGDEATLLGALHAGMAAMMDYVPAEERAPLNREIEMLAARAGDRAKQRRAHARLVFDLVALGDFAGAAERVAAYGRLADETRLPHHRWRTPLMRAMLADIEGRFDESAALADEAEALARASGDRESERSVATFRFASASLSWDLAAMRAALPAVVREWGAIPGAQDLAIGSEALLAAQEEDGEATRRLLARIGDQSMVWVADLSMQAWLVPALCAAGDQPRAERALARLRPHSRMVMTAGMSGYTWMGVGAGYVAMLASLLGRWDEADATFTEAVERLAAMGARPVLARTRYEWARSMQARGGQERRARELFEAAAADASALKMTGLLQAIDRRRATAPPVPAASSLSLRQEGEYWTLEWGGAAPVRLRDSRGLQILAALVAAPGREVHALDLASPGAAVDGGDSGELLDEEARAAYRSRVEELRETLAEAESFGDPGRGERARAELEALTVELSRAVGLGGRERRAGSAAERARVAVQRRVKDALERINEAAPSLGEHLARTIYTGAFCSYRPDEPRRAR